MSRRPTGFDRRRFVTAGLGGLAWAAVPGPIQLAAGQAPVGRATDTVGVRAVVRAQTLFAGIRAPITSRAQLAPRVESLDRACAGKIAGPLTHIFRFDTPVEGYDSEIGYPVSAPVVADGIVTHTLREMHFFARTHTGPVDTLRETSRAVSAYMSTRGLSPELELVEVYLDHRPGRPLRGTVDVMASYLGWPELYRAQLVRVLGAGVAAEVWKGGERITPHTAVDPRCAWVGSSIERLRQVATLDQQFDVLSRVALVRPTEDVATYRAIYEQTGDITAVFRAQDERLAKTPTGGFIDPPRFDGKTLHVSKVPRDGEAYKVATTQTARRQAFCFCALIREAAEPRVDPVFCYRAAGWARQFWEPILGVQFTRCTITHSILKGDGFCAWDYHLDGPLPRPGGGGASATA